MQGLLRRPKCERLIGRPPVPVPVTTATTHRHRPHRRRGRIQELLPLEPSGRRRLGLGGVAPRLTQDPLVGGQVVGPEHEVEEEELPEEEEEGRRGGEGQEEEAQAGGGGQGGEGGGGWLGLGLCLGGGWMA